MKRFRSRLFFAQALLCRAIAMHQAPEFLLQRQLGTPCRPLATMVIFHLIELDLLGMIGSYHRDYILERLRIPHPLRLFE